MLRHCFSQTTILKIDAVRAIDENELLDLNMVFSVGETGCFEFVIRKVELFLCGVILD